MTRKHHLARCEDCTLWDAPVVPSEIPDDWSGKYLLVGQQPGRQELRRGQPFIGPSGELLRGIVRGAGFSSVDVAYTNAILCGAPNQREPTEHELSCCRPRLTAGVEHAERVLAMGKHACWAILGPEVIKSVFKERGRYRYAPDGTPVMVTIHPAYVLRRLGDKGRSDPSMDFCNDVQKLRRQPYEYEGTVYRIATASDTEGWIRRIAAEASGSVVSIDLECDNRPWPRRSRYLVSPYRDPILCASLSWRVGHALVVPSDLLLAFSEEWCRLFRDPRILWTGHNVKFDFKMLHIWLGDAPRYPHFFDTLLAHYAVDERKGTHGLKPRLVGEYFDVEDWEPGLIQKHVRARTEGWGTIPKDDLYEYAAYDGDFERRLYFPLRDAVEQEGVEDLLDFLLEVTDTLIRLELQGAPVDLVRLNAVEAAHTVLMDESEALLQQLVRDHFEQRVAEDPLYRKYMNEDVPTKRGNRAVKRLVSENALIADFNVRSVQQVAHYLYDIMGYTPPTGRTIKTKSGRSTNAEALEKLHARHPDNPFFETLRAYRKHKKFVSTYCANLRVLAGEGPDPSEPAFFPQYMLIGTETGRLSGSIGMTWPEAADRDMPTEHRIRTCFVVPPGKVWVKIDYSQAELRLFGWYAGDPFLQKVYGEGKDLHNEVALALFGKSRYELGSKYSRAVKAVNFGFIYRIRGGEEEFVEGMLLDQKTARELIDKYNKQLARALEWKKEQIRTMLEQHEVVTAAGRRRRFPVIGRANQEEAMKASINAPVQSLSSDLILASLPKVQQLTEAHPEWEAAMVLLLHDEIDLVMLPEAVPEFVEKVRPIMEVDVPARFGIYPEDMPLRVDFSTGPSWGEVEDYNG